MTPHENVHVHDDGANNNPHTTPNNVLDQNRVQELLSLNSPEEPFVFEELLELFVSETTAQMALLRGSATRGECASIRRTAHRLKGSSRSFGIPLMGDQCEILEQIGDSADPAWLRAHIEQMEETFALAVRSLQRYAQRRA